MSKELIQYYNSYNKIVTSEEKQITARLMINLLV